MLLTPIRDWDQWGAGYYGAPRGDHTHHGIDFCAFLGSRVCAFTHGRVTKLGYPYGDDLSFRYVQVTDDEGRHCRYFYVNPMVDVGDHIAVGQIIGQVQDLTQRYPDITEHYHFEVMNDESEYLNPESYLEEHGYELA